MDEETQAPAKDAPVETTETAETQPSEASNPVNNETPEASQEVKESDVKAEETVEEKLYAGKYKSVEDLEKAYQSAQSEATKLSQDRAELSRLLEESFASPSEPVAQTEETDSYEDVDPVRQELDGLKRDSAVSKFAFSHPDADGTVMNQVLQSDPMVKNIQGYEAKLEYAYLKSQNMTSKKAVEEATKKAAQQTQAKIVEKQTAQVETAGKAEKIDERTDILNRMQNARTNEDAEKARREYIRKYLV